MTILALLVVFNTALSLPKGLLPAICWVESQHTANAVNESDPSYGTCQIKVDTANWMRLRHKVSSTVVTKEDLLKPEINALYGALYIAYQWKRYETHKFREYCTISSYNAGSCIGSNKGYVKKVRKAWKRFK